MIVRYEDLVAARAEQMRRVAAFLEIEWDECLLQQTIARQPAEPNSSFHQAPRTGFVPATARERIWLSIARQCHRLL